MMLDKIDIKIKLDIYITIIATIISVDFIISSYIWNNYASQILSILVIILPTVYIVGNLIIRGIMDKEMKETRDRYEEDINEVNEGVEEMVEEINRLKEENIKLKEKV